MSSQEDINIESPLDNVKDVFEPKQAPKIIRVLTVLAYVLSVSMAAILLSIYYIFIWQGKPHIGAQTSFAEFVNPSKNDTRVDYNDTHIIPSHLIKDPPLLLEENYVVTFDLNDLNTTDGPNFANHTSLQQQYTEDESELDNETTTSTPIMTTTEEVEEEENTTWPDYSEDFVQKKKRSIFLKRIMNFKYAYDDDTKLF